MNADGPPWPARFSDEPPKELALPKLPKPPTFGALPKLLLPPNELADGTCIESVVVCGFPKRADAGVACPKELLDGTRFNTGAEDGTPNAEAPDPPPNDGVDEEIEKAGAAGFRLDPTNELEDGTFTIDGVEAGAPKEAPNEGVEEAAPNAAPEEAAVDKGNGGVV